MEEIEGRTTDFVVASDGTQIHGLSLIYILREVESIESFKIVQESISATSVFIVPAEGYSREVEAEIISAFKARLGNDVLIAINIVNSISAEASGKFRYVTSKVVS